ncbi:MAG: response regulator [Pseudomonadota bacterium]
MSHKILIVDDDRLFLAPLVQDMSDLGHEIERAHSVDDGLEKLRSNEYDALIVDNMMRPGPFDDMATMGGKRTGIFFVQYVRLHFPDLPIVLFSVASPSEYDHLFLMRNGIKFAQKQTSDARSLLDLVEKTMGFEPLKLSDALELKPGMFGLKVDIRKFFAFWTQKRGKG